MPVRTKKYRKQYRRGKADFAKLSAMARPRSVNLSRYVKKKINEYLEPKYHDMQRTNQTITNAGETNCLTRVVQGAADTNRIGDKITLSSIKVRLWISGDNSATGFYAPQVRVIFYQWHPIFDSTTQQTAPAISTILANGPIGGAAPEPLSEIQHDPRNQFNILFDKNVKIVGQSNAGVGNNSAVMRYITMNLPLKKARKKLFYQAGSQTNCSEHIFMMILGNQAATAPGNPTFVCQARINFRDA